MAAFKRIALPPYALDRGERDQQLDPVTWHDIARMNRQQFVDISTVFSQQGLLLVDRGWHLAARYGQHPVQAIHLLIASLTFEQVGMVVHRLAIPIDKLKAAIAHALQKYSSKKVSTRFLMMRSIICFLMQYGMRVIAWDGQRVYYWGRIITSWFLAQQLTKKIIRRIIIATGYLYGIFGIGSLLYALYQLHLLGETVLALPGHLSIATLVFWSSLLVDGYLYYMFQ